MSKTGAKHQTKNVSGLTERETEVLTMRNDGKTYKEIADSLGISTKTVDGTLRRAREKEMAK
jgi:RNA polymerase sigma factor (sigma-70 family)